MPKTTFAAILLLLFPLCPVFAQDDLLDMIDAPEAEKETVYINATFKATKVINVQSNEIPGAGVMQFMILHRFGAINDDFLYNFFGLEQANTRFSLDYSINNWLNFGVGRSSASKTYDGFIKAKLLRQSTGGKNVPVSITAYSSINYSALRWQDDIDHYETDRLSYSYQLIIARKFNDWLSLELVPTMVHYNLVQTIEQSNDIFGLGFAGRFKLTNRIAVTGEYMLQMPQNTYLVNGIESNYNNSASIGVDIETGGHVFQLHVTNSRAMADPQWIGRTPGSWANGDIFFGFNISRVFTLVKPKVAEEPQW